MALQQVTDLDFQAEVLQAKQPVVVGFLVPWMRDPQGFKEALESLAASHQNIKFAAIDAEASTCGVDFCVAVPMPGGVETLRVPSMVLFRDGQVIERALDIEKHEDLEIWLDTALGNIPAQPDPLPRIFALASGLAERMVETLDCVRSNFGWHPTKNR